MSEGVPEVSKEKEAKREGVCRSRAASEDGSRLEQKKGGANDPARLKRSVFGRLTVPQPADRARGKRQQQQRTSQHRRGLRHRYLHDHILVV